MLQKVSSQFDSVVTKTVQPLLKNQYFFGVIHLFLILYAAKIAPNLPPVVLDLLDNFFVKLLCMFGILVLAKISPMTSLLVALAFLVTMNYVTKGKFIELMKNVRRHQLEALEMEGEAELEDEAEAELEGEAEEEAEAELVDTTKPLTEEADAKIPLASGCLPDRKVDMSAVSGVSAPNSFSAVDFD